MAHFRIYCLDTDGKIISGEDIEADDLSEAIGKAQSRCENISDASADRIEIWQGENCVFTTMP